ncbi:hypothetical protein JG687_00015927 [Phytophthora cactorum]|uniref:Uncharacterized protein n=1 Tax=Phytophthora cactorum TaxID=29920 RepID=A0A8T1TS11_9STRA|nr:hypothetical protein JG687_00015927 [Phytophthora cactorum]
MDHTDETYEVVKQSLPSYATAKNDPYKCALKHALVGQHELAHTPHKLRTIITVCKSARCTRREVKCHCRYNMNECQASDLVSIGRDGEHTMLDNVGSSSSDKRSDDGYESIGTRRNTSELCRSHSCRIFKDMHRVTGSNPFEESGSRLHETLASNTSR